MHVSFVGALLGDSCGAIDDVMDGAIDGAAVGETVIYVLYVVAIDRLMTDIIVGGSDGYVDAFDRSIEMHLMVCL